MTRWSARGELLDNPPDFLALRSAHRQSLGASPLCEGIPLLDSPRRRSRMSPRALHELSERARRRQEVLPRLRGARGATLRSLRRASRPGVPLLPRLRSAARRRPFARRAAPGPSPVEDRLTRHIPANLAAKIRDAGGGVAGERKLVTVLFSDLVGSTSIAERLDPEEYHDLLDEYLELAFREVYRVEGIVNQIAGDGFMALFGAPVAHEDAPHRAVSAALAIRDAVARLSDDVGRRHDLSLRVRVGVHTGP